MKIFGISSLLYSLGYFTIRNMLAILLITIVNDSQNISQIALLSSVFNFSYAISQIFNGFFIDKFGFKFICLASICAFLSLFMFKGGLDITNQVISVFLIGTFSSAGTLSITYFIKKAYNSSTIILGILRLVLITLSGICINQFNKLLSSGFPFYKIIYIIQGFFILSFTLLSINLLINKGDHNKKIDKIEDINEKPIDRYFIFLCILGIISSFPYFFFNGGFLNVLYKDIIISSGFIVNISYGFAAGNLLVLLSRYINFRIIFIVLSIFQILSLLNIFYNFIPLNITYSIIGLSYIGHILPVMHITKTYKNPIFLAGLYNFSIMFFSSFGLLSIVALISKKYNNSIECTTMIIKSIIISIVFNLIIGIILYIKNKDNKY